MKSAWDISLEGPESIELLAMDPDSLFLARDIETTGIQEKYLKRQLTAQEPLTPLDVQRFLIHTGMAEQVHTTTLNARAMGTLLHQERVKKAGQSVPYSIPMMVNAGREGEPPYTRWLSVVVTINPLRSSFSYQVHAGCKLTDQQKSELATILNEALRMEDSEKGFSPSQRPLSLRARLKAMMLAG